MPTLIESPTRIEAAGNKPKLIDEYVGRVRSGTSAVSIAHMRSPAAGSSRGKRLSSTNIRSSSRGPSRRVTSRRDGRSSRPSGPGRGRRVGASSTPESDGAEYVAVCLPAFSPETVHRDPG